MVCPTYQSETNGICISNHGSETAIVDNKAVYQVVLKNVGKINTKFKDMLVSVLVKNLFKDPVHKTHLWWLLLNTL